MKASRSTYNLWAWFLVDAISWVLALYVGLALRFGGDVPPLEFEYFLRLSPLSTAGLLGSFFYCGVYRRDVGDEWSWRGLWWGWVGGVAISFAVLFLLKIPYSRLAFLVGAVLFFGLSVVLRAGLTLFQLLWGISQRVLALGFDDGPTRERLRQSVSESVAVDFLSNRDSEALYGEVREREPDFVLVNGETVDPERIKTLVEFGSRSQIPVRIYPSTDQLFFSQTGKVSWEGKRLLRSELHYRLQQQMAIKTVFDYVMGSVLFLVALPILLLVSLIILLLEGRPVFYTQARTGRGGEQFTVYKFRTMVPDADEKGPALTEGRDDPRITTLGCWLRRWSLDELPQLWNVLRGEMSLVGPRPEIPSITEDYDPQQQRVLWLKPGLTGLSQVRGRQELELEEKLRIDQEYLSDYSIGLDLWILLKTVVAVIRGRGAA